MDFCRWVYGLHKNSPKEVTKEFVDECFVKLCCLVKTQIDEATKSGTKYVFGQISGDSFHQDDEGN